MDRLKLRETILRKIEKPVIPDKKVFCPGVWSRAGQQQDSDGSISICYRPYQRNRRRNCLCSGGKVSDRSDYLKEPGGTSSGKRGYFDSICK